MPGEVSQLLLRWGEGDHSALAELTPLVYGELRRLGLSALRHRHREAILQPTALVHEAWLRLVRQQLSFETRAQFYALAAKLMRDILVDQLRRQQALKRGGSQIALSLDDASASEQPRCLDFLILDEALTNLAEIKPRYTQIAELRYLAGLTIAETAEVLKISHATVEREWNFARLWLRRELEPDRHPQVSTKRTRR
jgi:RNA polymerase sigma factor (TIGR02999 family)